MSNSALASLTAQYTDSENEDDQQESPDSQNSQASQVSFWEISITRIVAKKIPHLQVIIPPQRQTPQHTPEKRQKDDGYGKERKKKRKKSKKAVKRLVSYQDDTIISEDGEEEEEVESLSSDSEGEVGSRHHADTRQTPQKHQESPMEVDDNSFEATHKDAAHNKGDKYAKYGHYGFTLPPEPKGKPLPELTEKIKQLYEKMETNNNMDMNRIIQQRKEFRNPSIYEKLIQFCDINEFGTNYPPEIYDPLQWGSESFYEDLARVQKNEMLKRQKEKKDTDKIEQVSALARKVEEEAKKRYNYKNLKWIQILLA